MRLKAARSKLREIIIKTNDDEASRLQLHENPMRFLVKEGLPYDVIEDYLREAAIISDTPENQIPPCANTCALTRW
ncbi:hypothetical protein [Tengunoibacter tsumagoiensis]|uniref:Uncharacterized protein n=1 Tax=Tengunoibacter tsumagoiensis TaxID=2014871 RepID=A0A402A6C3_9CHLR|nr:hypothetical protein [Tengunoibacter tsumagoiensis]GCE14639.1 hypothetical protein KTT_44980 [Tengunoibacter tsumagoiensis]